MHRRPHRLAPGSYVGFNAYSLTAVTHSRQRAFLDASFAEFTVMELLRSASLTVFGVGAYCLMPDHAHVLVVARSPTSDLRRCVARWRQVTGFRWRQLTGRRLWQEGYWDRTLRSADDELRVAAYIVANPVRAGLAIDVRDYAFVGSTEYSLEQLANAPADSALVARGFGPLG